MIKTARAKSINDHPGKMSLSMQILIIKATIATAANTSQGAGSKITIHNEQMIKGIANCGLDSAKNRKSIRAINPQRLIAKRNSFPMKAVWFMKK
jgi:hypothetical protein